MKIHFVNRTEIRIISAQRFCDDEILLKDMMYDVNGVCSWLFLFSLNPVLSEGV